MFFFNTQVTNKLWTLQLILYLALLRNKKRKPGYLKAISQYTKITESKRCNKFPGKKLVWQLSHQIGSQEIWNPMPALLWGRSSLPSYAAWYSTRALSLTSTSRLKPLIHISVFPPTAWNDTSLLLSRLCFGWKLLCGKEPCLLDACTVACTMGHWAQVGLLSSPRIFQIDCLKCLASMSILTLTSMWTWLGLRNTLP